METAEPVVISAIMMSDHVIREHGTGKLTLVGIFSTWNCPGFPFQTPQFWVTTFLTNIKGLKDKGANIAIRLEDPQTGHVLASLAAKVQFAPEQQIPNEAMLEIPLPVSSMIIHHPGTFRAIALVDNEQIAMRTFTATPTTMNLGPQK